MWFDKEPISDQNLPYDRFNIYVNKDLVGEKVPLAENNDIHQVENHLEKKGINDFNILIKGGHFVIKANKPSEVETIKALLGSYLVNR
ncbi:hypothetical protein [Selenihalanaerobacter shriftii]|uniref:Uncharacterized protein n=1 Tax=Selenihalanaerobacter shriftii TaxID=142842 RepID=A0A1T4LZE7_9FIRM|nr:hypothetical protein [Selenihalanaerobacter shriftii]SJZ59834.1 hypothetical protein SAMN02745118_01305 [Selenihalanaerobacter shriftii]